MMHRTLQLIIGFLTISHIQAGLICPLCGSVDKVPTRWDHILSQNPLKTCRSIYFEMAMKPIDDPTCFPIQQQYQDICCNGSPPPPAPAPAPVPNESSGSNPYCRICENDDYPGYPEVMISARYVGTYSCHSLYHRGRNGQIPGFMCGPLRDGIHDKCGCGIRAPTKPPTPAPTRSATPPPTGQHQRKKPDSAAKYDLRLPRRHAYSYIFNRRGLRGNQDSDSPVLVEN